MRIKILAALFILCVSGCAAMGSSPSTIPSPSTKSGVNTYNPFVHARLPAPLVTPEKQEALKKLGARASNVQDEAAKRPRWKEEFYPIIFGPKAGKHELLVFIDFSEPSSLAVWNEIMGIRDKLNPKDTTVAIFGVSAEKYGTELMGCGIWVSYARPADGMAYFNYALNSWNEAKKAQIKRLGKAKNFVYENDTVSSDTELPFIYHFFARLSPRVPDQDLTEIIKYGFDAGNVNAFEARNMAANYKIKKFPAIVADGKLLKNPGGREILDALK